MEKDVRDSFERIEKRLDAIEELGKALKHEIGDVHRFGRSSHVRNGREAGQILQLLESKKK